MEWRADDLKQKGIEKRTERDLHEPKYFPNGDMVQTEARVARGRVRRMPRSDGLFEVAHICGVGRRGLGDPRVFGPKDWGTTRGGTWL